MTATTEEKRTVSLEVWGIVQLAQAGDVEAFGQLYDRYIHTIYRYIYSKVRNPHLAEDLTADVFCRALKRIDSFTWQGRDFGAWLITIARRIVADHYKSCRTRRELLSTFNGNEVGNHGNEHDKHPESHPEDTVVAHLTNVELLSAVKRLSPDQGECIVLRFLMGRTVPETAAIMGKQEGAVKSLQYRAVRALATKLPGMAEARLANGRRPWTSSNGKKGNIRAQL